MATQLNTQMVKFIKDADAIVHTFAANGRIPIVYGNRPVPSVEYVWVMPEIGSHDTLIWYVADILPDSGVLWWFLIEIDPSRYAVPA